MYILTLPIKIKTKTQLNTGIEDDGFRYRAEHFKTQYFALNVPSAWIKRLISMFFFANFVQLNISLHVACLKELRHG